MSDRIDESPSGASRRAVLAVGWTVPAVAVVAAAPFAAASITTPSQGRYPLTLLGVTTTSVRQVSDEFGSRTIGNEQRRGNVFPGDELLITVSVANPSVTEAIPGGAARIAIHAPVAVLGRPQASTDELNHRENPFLLVNPDGDTSYVFLKAAIPPRGVATARMYFARPPASAGWAAADGGSDLTITIDVGQTTTPESTTTTVPYTTPAGSASLADEVSSRRVTIGDTFTWRSIVTNTSTTDIPAGWQTEVYAFWYDFSRIAEPVESSFDFGPWHVEYLPPPLEPISGPTAIWTMTLTVPLAAGTTSVAEFPIRALAAGYIDGRTRDRESDVLVAVSFPNQPLGFAPGSTVEVTFVA